MAVGRRVRSLLGRDVAAGARAVLDHEWLAEKLLHLAADDAREHVAGAARRERDQKVDRLGRIIGRERRRQRQQHGGKSGSERDEFFEHRSSRAVRLTNRGSAS